MRSAYGLALISILLVISAIVGLSATNMMLNDITGLSVDNHSIIGEFYQEMILENNTYLEEGVSFLDSQGIPVAQVQFIRDVLG